MALSCAVGLVPHVAGLILPVAPVIPPMLAVSMDVPPMVDGFSFMATSYRPELYSGAAATPDMGTSMLVATAAALATGLLSAGLVMASDSKELDEAMGDLCSLVELPELDLSLVEPEKEWWLCPGATLDDGEECQTVYYDGETQIACAY